MRFKLSVIILLGLILSILLPAKISAEVLNVGNFEHFSIDQGLSNEQVTSIYQDSKGYMWIGTTDGLNRFDGERLKIYNCNTNSKDRLSSSYINIIEEDEDGNIWIGTDGGLDFLERETGKIIRMKNLENDEFNLGELKITALLSDNNIMWVGTDRGLFKVDIKNLKIQVLDYDKANQNSLTNSYIKCLEDDDKNNLWIGTTSGINIIDKKNLNVEYSENEIKGNKLFIYDIEFDKLGNVWISTKDGIFIYNVKEDKRQSAWFIDTKGVKEFNLKENKVKKVYDGEGIYENINNNGSILSDSKGNMWISSSNGIIKYLIDNETVELFKKDVRKSNSLNSNSITCFYEDFNGTIWVGTDKGVNILNKGTQFYTNYEYENNKGFLYDKNIVSVLIHDKYFWVATKYDGIYIYDIEKGSFIKNIDLSSNNEILGSQYIKYLFEITSDEIVAVTNKGIVSFDTNDFSYENHLVEGGYSSEASYIHSDGNLIWVATTTDFISLNIKTREKNYFNDNLMKFKINPGGIRYILPDYKDNNILWLGGIGMGLVKYDKQKGVLEKYTSEINDQNSLISNDINCMNFDSSGNLWIGTNVGLSKFNEKTKKFKSYTTSEGLTNNFINSIVTDNNSDIWISTNKGLNKLDIEENKVTNFTKMDGIIGYQFNLNSNLKTKEGNIIFGSTDGFVYFNPNDIQTPKSNKNKVVIGDIFIGKNKIDYDGNEILLNYNDKNLSIDYFLPSYENLNNITYEYMIEGIDKDWIYVDHKSGLDIKSIDPGRYTLKLRARDGHGSLTEETSMNIRVKNPIWKTPVAYLIYILILGAIVFYIFNYVKILHNLVNQKTMSLNKQLE